MHNSYTVVKDHRSASLGGRHARRVDLDGAVAVAAQGPERDIEMVRAHVGEPAARVFPVAAPRRIVLVHAAR